MVRIAVAGLAAGIAFNAALFLFFRWLGFGWEGGGILLRPGLQSPKLIDVWTRLEPLPLVVTHPVRVGVVFLFFGVAKAVLYRSVRAAWPPPAQSRRSRLALVLFLIYLFWEVFTPLNLFGEPLGLAALELVFWVLIAAAEAWTIVGVMETTERS